MRYLKDLLALAPSLLLWTLTIVSARCSASPNNLQQPLVLPWQTPHVSQYAHDEKSHHDRHLLARIRDSITQTIWRIPTDERLRSANIKSPASRNGPPSQLLARYGGDLVLRFEIRTAEEAEALADAINVLILDVWEFTMEWVDIRLSKDVVSFPNKVCCCCSTNRHCLGSFLTWFASSFATACTYSIDA